MAIFSLGFTQTLVQLEIKSYAVISKQDDSYAKTLEHVPAHWLSRGASCYEAGIFKGQPHLKKVDQGHVQSKLRYNCATICMSMSSAPHVQMPKVAALGATLKILYTAALPWACTALEGMS